MRMFVLYAVHLSVKDEDAFPEMRGFSPRNLKYMRKFAEC